MRSQTERRPRNSAIFERPTAERYGRAQNPPGLLPLLRADVTGAKPRAAFRSGRLAATADQVRQVGNERLACQVELAAQVIPERDALLGTGLGQTEKSIAAIASGLAAGAGTDLAAGGVAAGVVLWAIGVPRGLPPLQDHPQLGPGCMQ